MARAVLFLVALLAWSVGAGNIGAAAAQGLDVISPGEDRLVLERKQAVVVRLPRPAASVFVADESVADVQVKSPRLVYIFGREVGETTLFAVDDGDRVVLSERVRVQHNLSGLRKSLESLEPDQAVKVAAVGDSLVLRGSVPDAETAENIRRIAARFAEEDDIVNRLAVTGPTQVNIQVRVAEVSRNLTKEFGIDWDIVHRDLFGETFRFFGGGASGLTGLFGGSANIATGDVSIDSMINLLSDEGLMTMLAEPNLTAMSGETASFLAGGEFPIPISQGDDAISIEFKEFGVRLEFTPVLLGGGRISLSVAPEVSELNFADGVTLQGFNIPSLNTRRASTTIELASGQSFAIAGLMQNSRTQNLSEFPGLAELPVLGALFRSDRFRQGETELAIIATPYIVRPTSERRLAAPTDGMVPPNDVERIFFGRMQGENTEDAMAARQRLSGHALTGSVGFMLE